MSIQSVNAINFTGKTSQTKNGNEYDKTNAGKYTGMGVGAAIGAGYPAYIMYKVTRPGNKYEFKRCMVDARNAIKQAWKNSGIDTPKSVLSAKFFSKTMKIIPVLSGAVTLLVGLGLGAVVDGIINHTRAKKADKKVL